MKSYEKSRGEQKEFILFLFRDGVTWLGDKNANKFAFSLA